MKRFLAIAAAMLALLLAPAVGAAELGDDGLHKEEWFSETFRDLREDLATANAEGKRLAIIYEQRGCIYCRKLHEEVFSDPAVSDYIRSNFVIVQYNLFGDLEVTDFDGEALTEKTAARKWRVVFTPTIIFMPEEVREDESLDRAAVEIMPGAFGKSTTLHMFQWVRDKGYETEEHFQKYHARRLDEDRAAGRIVTD